MARRSPLNERYQKYTGPQGKTRKSAAAAKPKKASSSGVKQKASSASNPRKRAFESERAALKNPDTPEFRALRKQWWILLISGLVLTGISYLIGAYVHTPWARNVQGSTLGIAYVAIGYALYLDFKKMRPMRTAAYKQAKSGKVPKAEKPAPKDSTSDSAPK